MALSQVLMRLLCLTSLVLVAQPSMAQQSPEDMPATPHFEVGKPLMTTLADGREATIRVTSATLGKQVEIPFQVYENDCSDFRGMSCVYRTGYRKIWVQLVWTKNPDATRLNQIVNLQFGDSSSNSSPIESQTQATGLEVDFLPGLASGMPATTIECNDFSWLPDATKDAPAKLTVLRWENERMSVNPETGVSENRTDGGALQVELSKVNPTFLKIDKVGSFTSTSSFLFPALVIGDVASVTMRKANGELCQAALKPAGLGNAAANIGSIDKQRPPAATAPDYIFGSSEVSQALQKKNNPFTTNLNFLSLDLPGKYYK